jgi:hypothetical protein
VGAYGLQETARFVIARRPGALAGRVFKQALRVRVLLAAILPFSLAAAEAVDESKLPPPAAVTVDFARDIKPIFEQSCLRCHGAERPKSNFRLTDRESALKGGATGVDLIPGQSAKSLLIRYVARLVEDMEMPPAGKGEPLTTNQVALLRAWIDQGANWEKAGTTAQSQPQFELVPVVSWIGVHGDATTFRALEWMPNGWNGGAQDFRYEQKFPGGKSASLEGHALRDDYQVTLDLRKQDLGFTRFGYEQFRKYDDDIGGYYAPFSPPAFRLDRDLHLDIGRAWAEVGLTRPNGPRLVLGYEYAFKEGNKSMLTWGPVSSPTGNFQDARSIYPSAQSIDEHSHLIRFDASYDLKGFLIEDNVRAEFYHSDTVRADAMLVPVGQVQPDLVSLVRQGQDQTQVANTLRLEKPVTDWLFLSGGYLYSWIDGNASFNAQPQDGNGQPAAGSAWYSNEILLNQWSQILNFNSQFRPLPGLTLAAGAQGGWTQKEAFGDVSLDEISDPTDPTAGILRYPALLHANVDRTAVEENILLRYTRVPFTALYAEARLKQETISLYEDEEGGPHSFVRDTDESLRWQEYRAGFNTSPWRHVSFDAGYKFRLHDADYNTLPARDQHPIGFPGEGYPAFITARQIETDEVGAKLVLRPWTWLKTTLGYQYLHTDYRTTTDPTDPTVWGADATPGGQVLAGVSEGNVYSANFVVTPWRRLYLSTTFSYQDSKITTADNDSSSIVPYRGDIYTVLANASYALDGATSLMATYSFSKANYGQDNWVGGLPLGIDYDRHGVQVGVTRRFKTWLTARLQYGYYRYSEPTSGNLRDYTAQMVLAALTVNWR